MQSIWTNDVPGDLKQTQWEAEPNNPRFRVLVCRRGHPKQEMLFAPAAWASHRRTMKGYVWPGRNRAEINFADVHTATDLNTGVVLDRVGLWKLVLAHRDDVPPWYVQWADQHLMMLCMVVFARQELGRFQSSMRTQLNAAFLEVGYTEIDTDGLKPVGQLVRDGYDGEFDFSGQVALLTDIERHVCRNLARAFLIDKSKDPGVADRIFQQTAAS